MIAEVLVNNNPAMNGTLFEVVERKGLGHPDTICDLVAERVSYDLGHYYLKACGRVLHYNVDIIIEIRCGSNPPPKRRNLMKRFSQSGQSILVIA